MGLPFVSIIVLSYNSGNFIEDCLKSLKKIEYDGEYEVIVVDNASTDNSVKIIKKFKPWIKFVETGKNLGYAGGNNVGVKEARGVYIVFLSPDTVVDKNFLKELVKTIKNDKSLGAVSSKVLYKKEKNKVNTVGGFWSILGISGSIGEGRNAYEFDKEVYTFFPTGCSMIMNKKVYLDIGKFDDDHFLYCEDSDIGWRLWDNGYKVGLAPHSVVYHIVGGSLKLLGKESSSYTWTFYNTRNGFLTIVKNATKIDLVWMLPLYVISWSALFVLFLIRGKFRPARAVLDGILWPMKNIGWVIQKRWEMPVKRTGKAKAMMTGLFESVKIFLGAKFEKHFS